MRLDNWRVEQPEQQQVLSAVTEWFFGRLYGELPPGQQWLYLQGPFGTGKTHLALGLAWEIVMSATWPPSVAVLNWATHVEQAIEEIGWPRSRPAGDGRADLELATARESDLLVLDDLDKADGSRFTMRRLYSLVDARLMSGRTTILTANRPIADLLTHWAETARAEERSQVADKAGAIVERLAQACREVAFNGASFRLR